MSVDIKVGSVVTLRIRTPELVASGPLRPTLMEIAQAAVDVSFADDPEMRPTITLPPAFEMSASDGKVITDLAEAVASAAESFDIVLVDLMMDQTQVRFGAIEQLFFGAAEQFETVWPERARLIVLISRVPEDGDDIAEILHLPGLKDRVAFLDENGGRFGAIWGDGTLTERVSEAVTVSASDVRDSAERTALRRRGVFRVATSSREAYAAHKYSVDDTELANVLRGYFEATGTDLVILDTATAPWLEEAGHGASVGGSKVYLASDLEPSGEEPEIHEQLIARLTDPGISVILVVPMIRNAERAKNLLARLAELGQPDVQVLSIFFASKLDTRLPDVAAGGWASSATSSALGQDVHYLLDVELTRLRVTDWRVQMARFFGEEMDDKNAEWEFSRTGLWSLLDERGAESGYTQGDNGVLMRMTLDDWDAGWLAAALIRKARTHLGRDAGEMLMVMPDDSRTAIRAIGDALKRQQGTSVVRVPRTLIEDEDPQPDDELVKELAQFQNGSIVLVDESTATYATLRGLQRVVFAAMQRDADFSTVVLDLPEGQSSPPADLPFAPLYGWRPTTRKVVAAS